MTATEFHGKMKQHCENLNGECSQCCFLDYCYSQKKRYNRRFSRRGWQRLIDGKNIQKHDITLLNHELLEQLLMKKGWMNY